MGRKDRDILKPISETIARSASVAVATWDGVFRCECGDMVPKRGEFCDNCTAKFIEDRRMSALAAASKTLPAWAWCRFGTAEFAERTTKGASFSASARTWTRKVGNLVLLGPTGYGKTASAVALGHRILDAAGKQALAPEDFRFATGVRFVSAPDLAAARRAHPLGQGDPQVVLASKNASCLILDELGFEPQADPTIPELLDYRYRGALPTVVTSGLTEREMSNRYGDATPRRLRELGRVVSAFESQTANVKG